MRIAVAGAGVLGLAIAVTLQRAGLDVRLFDPALDSPNASAVAAGLLAPVGEALFDPLARPHLPLMRGALARWPAFADSIGIDLAPGAIMQAASADGDALLTDAAPHPLGLLSPVDSRVADPEAALQALRGAFTAAGGAIEPRALRDNDAAADWTVLATGPGALAQHDLAPELAQLTPVKGQIAVLPHGPTEGPALRWPGGYLTPHPRGARAGATMEAGRSDTTVEPTVIAALAEHAGAHWPGLDTRDAYGQAGVRMTTPDGLPLVGPSARPRTLLAVGARRNGWLLAPLVADLALAYCQSDTPGPWAAALHPGRFEQAED